MNNIKSDLRSLILEEGHEYVDDFAYAEQRELIEVTLPSSLKKIGAHAFYNCRSLSKIIIRNCDTDIGNGAFKNCPKIESITMEKNGHDLKSLKAILSDVNQEVKVRLIYMDGEARLTFPFFIDNYEENTPARIIKHISEGAGAMYRECIGSEDISYRDYDDIFRLGTNLDIYNSATDIAMERLKYPYKLLETAREKYITYIAETADTVAKEMISKGDTRRLGDLLEVIPLDHGKIDRMIEFARRGGHSGVLSLLLESDGKYYGKDDERSGSKKNRYEF